MSDSVEALTELGSSGPWTIWEVAESDLVVPLENQPAVWEDVGDSQDEWLVPSAAWYLDREAHDVFLAADGPPEWQRIREGEDPDAIATEPVRVTDIEQDDDRISFDVDQVGQPVLVRASYFPNWQVSGAEGPYRVTPNLMVVVPTDTHVSLHYGWTPIDLLAWLLTFLGLAGLVLLARRPPIDVPAPAEPLDHERPDLDPDERPAEPVVDDERSPPDLDPDEERRPDEVPVGATD